MNSFRKNPVIVALITVLVLACLVNTKGDAQSLQPAGKTILVSPFGTDVSSCGSAAQPCQSIQYAVNIAVTGDLIDVAAGNYIYKPALDPCSFLVTRAVVCILDKHLTIIGGFSNGNWTVPDPAVNITTIDGQNTWRGVAVMHGSGTASLTMEGFTIQNGQATGNPIGNQYYGHAFGGGMWASFTSVNLKNMVFKNNITRGGSNPQIAQAGWAFGGGLAIEGPSTSGGSTLENLSFTGNQALGGSGSDGGGNAMGGGLMTSSVSLNATNLTLTNNLAKGGDTNGNGCNSPGGGFGGAVAASNNAGIQFSKITATNNQVIGANALGSAGCAGSGIGAGFFLESATVNITDTLLQSNLANGGNAKTGGSSFAGGIYADKVNLTLDSTKIISNTGRSGSSTSGGKAGSAGGGGVYLAAFDAQNYSSTITNCLFADNEAFMGNGINGTGGGGGLIIQATHVDITHSTFANNKLKNGISNGQAILVLALNGTSGKAAQANVRYSVITDHINSYLNNNAALEVFDGSTATISYLWLGNNTSHIKTPPGTIQDHIWKATGSAGYVSPFSPNFDYHLQASSPVIDLASGSTTPFDLDHFPRPFSIISDLGAFEYHLTSALTAATPINVMTDSNQVITRTSPVSDTNGQTVQWTANASCNCNWIYLGPTGNSQQTSGNTGTDLVIRIDPSQVVNGNYQATIVINSPSANPTSVLVSLLKVNQIFNVYLPFARR